MAVAIVDYGSGNLHSVEKSFRKVASEIGGIDVQLTSCPDTIAQADRVVLPGVGAFAACSNALHDCGLFAAVEHAAIRNGAPFLGICVGMQLLATVGLEHGKTPGFDWIPGRVEKFHPNDDTVKVPHMGWNELGPDLRHPLFAGLPPAPNVYFVHSYHFLPDEPQHAIAYTDHAGPIVAGVADGNIAGVQFHPEKSQLTGLAIIGNFLAWRP